jgi:predicted enzyme related to lactoylglutathione lyase
LLKKDCRKNNPLTVCTLGSTTEGIATIENIFYEIIKCNSGFFNDVSSGTSLLLNLIHNKHLFLFMDSVVHFEIPADDVVRANNFYKNVFGWNIEKAPMPDMEYYMAFTATVDARGKTNQPGAINGGMMPRNFPGEYPVLVINVASIEDAIAKAEKEGGTVVMPIMLVGDFGRYARVNDTEGNTIGIWEDVKK